MEDEGRFFVVFVSTDLQAVQAHRRESIEKSEGYLREHDFVIAESTKW